VLELKSILSALKQGDSKRDADKLQFILVEGFLIYSFPQLVELFDIKLFLSIPKDVCRRRRRGIESMTLTYIPSYLLGDPDYFEVHIWPNYVKYNAHALNDESLIVLNGEFESGRLLSNVVDLLTGTFGKHSPQLLADNISS
jgi:nicotinamide/nicotinate riboside kinase